MENSRVAFGFLEFEKTQKRKKKKKRKKGIYRTIVKINFLIETNEQYIMMWAFKILFKEKYLWH